MTAARPAARWRQAEGGFIIVAVIWILAALAALASAFAIYAGNSAVAARFSGERLQANALITAGLELTALRLIGRSAEEPRSSGEFQFRLAGADVVARFRTEGARIDLNEAPKEMLAGLFRALGAAADAADSYADRIVGWREKAKPDGQNRELGAYKDAGLKYGPRQAPFQNVAELRFVFGIPPELVEQAMPFVTLFNGMPQIDISAAPREVVAALPHMSPDLANAILARRGAQDQKTLLAQLGPARDSVSFEPRRASRVNLALTFRSGRRAAAEAVILLTDKDSEPYRILAWRDDLDGAGGDF